MESNPICPVCKYQPFPPKQKKPYPGAFNINFETHVPKKNQNGPDYIYRSFPACSAFGNNTTAVMAICPSCGHIFLANLQ